MRAAILSGELAPGSLLPSERELIARYNTTKSTAGKAIALLQAEGLVTTEYGRGRFVRSQPPLRRVSSTHRHAAHRSSGKPIFDTEAIAQGQVPSRQILEVGRVAAPDDIARFLEIPVGREVVLRKRLQSLDGQPAVISASYYPAWLANGTRLESPDALPEGPDSLIGALGHHFSYGIEVFRARMPTPEEGRLLQYDSGRVSRWSVCCMLTTTPKAEHCKSQTISTQATDMSSPSSGRSPTKANRYERSRVARELAGAYARYRLRDVRGRAPRERCLRSADPAGSEHGFLFAARKGTAGLHHRDLARASRHGANRVGRSRGFVVLARRIGDGPGAHAPLPATQDELRDAR